MNPIENLIMEYTGRWHIFGLQILSFLIVLKLAFLIAKENKNNDRPWRY